MGEAAAVALALVFLSVGAILASNIDVHHAVVREGPHEQSFFGFSVAQYSDSTTSTSWMIVGAPRDNKTSAKLAEKGVERPGTLYRCGVTQGSQCEPITVDEDFIYVDILDSDLNIVERQRDDLDNQWLGSSVSAVAHSAGVKGMIIACAPRYVDRTSSTKKWYPIGRCSVIDKDFKVIDQKLTPCKDSPTDGKNGVSYCQTGVSAKVSKDGRAVVLGAPGAYRWQGITQFVQKLDHDALFVDSTEQNKGADEFAYMGYSSDFADFNWKTDDRIYYAVVGAPRQDGYFGKAVVLEYDSATKRIDVKLLIGGTQFGAYFGHSVAAVDLDKDGFDDLLVGAPMHSEIHYEEGAVYVYMNNRKTHLEESRVLIGSVVGGRFGHAIAKANDLNGDSFDDVVISAPYTPDGGAIYIYHGSVLGIKEQPSQIIAAEDLNIPGLKAFGVSLSAGIDLDKNEYPDILVGAYSSDKAILLRSRPVVDVESTITVEPQFVNYPDDTKFNITVCLRYYGRNLPRQLEFEYNLTVDESRKMAGLYSRATFEGHGTPLRQNLTLVLFNESCAIFTLELRNRIIDMVNPIVVTLTYQLREEDRVRSSDGNPDTSQSLFPVLRSQPVHSISTQAYLLRDCGPDNKCIPDLQIISAQVNISGEQRDSFVIGSISEILVAVSVKNVKENAYNARLTATFPRELTILSSTNNHISCHNEREDKSQVICALGNPLGKQSIEFSIRMSVTGLTAASTSFRVKLEAVSANPEENTTLRDNSWTSPIIRTVAQADFGLSTGKAVPDRIGFEYSNPSVDVNAPLERESQIGTLVTHSFTVLNSGPSTVPQSELLIYWPLFLRKDDNDSYLLYIIDVQAPETVVCDTRRFKDPVGLATEAGTDDQTTSRKLRSIRTFGSLSYAEDVFSNSSCILCQLQPFAKGTSADITVVSRLYERSLVRDTVVELKITSRAVLSIPEISNFRLLDGLNKSLRLTTLITKPIEVTDESVEPWIIVLAVTGTILLLIGVIAVMRRLGFFKRSKKLQLQRKREQLDSLRKKSQNADN